MQINSLNNTNQRTSFGMALKLNDNVKKLGDDTYNFIKEKLPELETFTKDAKSELFCYYDTVSKKPTLACESIPLGNAKRDNLYIRLKNFYADKIESRFLDSEADLNLENISDLITGTKKALFDKIAELPVKN